MICKDCSEIIDDKSKFCMYCGQAIKDQQTWNIIICNDEKLWNKNAFDNFPSIIAHEYHRIYKLMLENKTYGAMMQIKDLLEVLVKFPVVVEMSRLREKEEKTKEDYTFTYNLLVKALSLGDWRNAINDMSKHNEHVFDSKFMKDLKNLYFKNNVPGEKSVDLVHWRNQTIGHGALAFDSDDNFKLEIKSLLMLISNHFNKWNNLYENMKILDENGTIFKGKDEAANLDYKNSNLFFQNNEEIKLSLYPFLLLWEKQFYIFDALIYDKEKYDVLSYPIGRKQYFKKTIFQEDIKNIFEESYNFLKRNNYLDKSIGNTTSAEDSTFLISYDDYLNSNDEEIYEIKILDDWLSQGLNQSEDKIFLLMMERGMGKTSWVKKISEDKTFDNDIMFKTIYLNDTYRSNWESIVSKINQTMITDNNHKVVIDDSKNRHIRMDAENIKVEIADFYKYYIDIYKKEGKADKIVLILDGIDEIKLDNNSNILDWIPTTEMLPEGFYIVLTCRNSEDISSFLNICLNELMIPEKNKLTIYRENEKYREVLEKYIKDNTGESDITTILNKSEYRFAYANILTKVIKHSNEENKKIVLKEDGVMEAFLGMIESYYEKRHLNYLYNLIYIIATAPEPVTIKELSYLLGDDNISFKLLGLLNDLKGILKYKRTDKRNRISIANEIYKESIIKILMKKDATLDRELKDKTTNLVSDMHTEFVSKEKDIVGEGQEFLLLHLNYYYNEGMTQYIDYNLFENIFDCAERYIKSFSYDDTKRGYDMLENADALYPKIPLNDNNDQWVEILLRLHIHLVCQYKLLFRWKDLYINDNISERLSMTKVGVELQLDFIKSIDDLNRYKDPLIASIIKDTIIIEYNVLIEYGSYYYIKKEYDKAKDMLLLAKNKMNEGMTQDKARYRKLNNLLYDTYLALGQKEEASKYYEEYNNLLKEIEDQNGNLVEEDYEARIFRLEQELMEIDDIESSKQRVCEEIEELENRIKNLDGNSYEYYNICNSEHLIIGMAVKTIGEKYLKTDKYFELLEFLKKMNEIKNKIQGRNFILLPEIRFYLAYYGVFANMKLGYYDDAFVELNLMKTGLDEIDNSDKLIGELDVNILYFKYILYIQLCRYNVFKNQDYRKAFDYLLKATDLYEERRKNSNMSDTTHIDYLKHILGLYVAIDLNEKEANKDILENLKKLFERYNPNFIEGINKYSWQNEYIIIDKKNDKFLSCAYGAYPKKFNLTGQYYEIDFKRVCNGCSYKDCIGYLKAGTFKLKK